MNSGNGNPICTSQSSITTSPCSGTCCPIGGMWSEWIPLGVCNDTCGGFGIIRRRRTCLTGPNCSCRGYSVRPFRCQLSPCIYPRLACVPGYSVQVVNGVIRCAQIPVSTIKVSTSSISTITTRPTTRTTTTTRASCCPNGGLWSPWGSWSSCNATCGACGLTKRTRLCGSAAYGCPCSSATGTTSETLPCNRQPCLYPISSCCSPYKLAKIGINFLCWTTTTSTSSTALPPTTRITSSLPVTTRTTTTAPTTTTAAPTMTTTTAALATTTKQAGTCCPTGGMWSEWTQLGTCSDTCGAFGTAPYNRI
uniref:Thrombospondin type 1 domain protein n=1 Tax=Acrobeloides nanus TaxID=290746 RepID=A0A914DEY4_9BILA